MGYVSTIAMMNDTCQKSAFDCAKQMVADFGYFSINAVVKAAGLTVSKSIIMWKRIVKRIEFDLRIRLIPVAGSFFKSRGRKVVNLLGENAPERHLATGRRDVAGYVSSGWWEAASVAEEKARRLEKIGTGFQRSAGTVRCHQKLGLEAHQLSLLEGAAPA
jgi:hypothetical protein